MYAYYDLRLTSCLKMEFGFWRLCWPLKQGRGVMSHDFASFLKGVSGPNSQVSVRKTCIDAGKTDGENLGLWEMRIEALASK
jgi:hypothetical protein